MSSTRITVSRGSVVRLVIEEGARVELIPGEGVKLDAVPLEPVSPGGCAVIGRDDRPGHRDARSVPSPLAQVQEAVWGGGDVGGALEGLAAKEPIDD